MTTNVFDGPAGLLATDSRWSVPYGRYIAYVDDANYDKLVRYGNAVLMFAGKGVVIQKWKDWIATKPTTLAHRPPVDEISVCIVEIPTKTVLFAERQEIKHADNAFFAGSGALPAAACWERNRDATRSIESAKLVDVFTGGEVKFVRTQDGADNLGGNALQQKPVHIDMVRKAIEERGMIMDRKTGLGGVPAAPFRLADVAAAAANEVDGELADFKKKLANGELEPEAPCNGLYDKWTPEQEAGLNRALSKVFGIK